MNRVGAPLGIIRDIGVDSRRAVQFSFDICLHRSRAPTKQISTSLLLALDTPGLETKFRMPRNGTDQALITAGRAFAADAVPLAGEFQKHEMPAHFVDELNADIAALEEAISGRARSRDSPVTATASLDATVERGIKAVRRLHAMVRNKFRDDPAALAAWESASHGARRARTVAPPQPEPPQPSTPPP